MASKTASRTLSESEFQRVFDEVRADIDELQLHNKVFAGVIGEFATYHQLQIPFRVAHEVWNRHSQIWNACTHAGPSNAADDYKWLLKCARRGMKVKTVVDNRQTARRMARIRDTGTL